MNWKKSLIWILGACVIAAALLLLFQAHGFSVIRESVRVNLVREDRWKIFLDGLVTTIEISLFSIAASILTGAGICALRMSRRKLISRITEIMINLIRRMPLLILLMLMMYVVFASSEISPATVAVLGFAIYFGAYGGESFRTGIESVDRGQWEAGYAMGFGQLATFRKIILPQALLRTIPVLKGLLTTLIKSTSIVGYIAIVDLTKAGDMVRSRTFDAFFPLLLSAALYLLLSWLLGLVLDAVYARLTPKHRTI